METMSSPQVMRMQVPASEYSSNAYGHREVDAASSRRIGHYGVGSASRQNSHQITWTEELYIIRFSCILIDVHIMYYRMTDMSLRSSVSS